MEKIFLYREEFASNVFNDKNSSIVDEANKFIKKVKSLKNNEIIFLYVAYKMALDKFFKNAKDEIIDSVGEEKSSLVFLNIYNEIAMIVKELKKVINAHGDRNLKWDISFNDKNKLVIATNGILTYAYSIKAIKWCKRTIYDYYISEKVIGEYIENLF